MTATFDILGIGNAIVDILVKVEDDFLDQHDIPKGSMQLVDSATSDRLYSVLGQAIECSGGSVANSIAGLASLGSRTAFIGKICDDQLGEVFAHDIRSLGVNFTTAKDNNGKPTAHCLVMVSPDAERTMYTYLGACADLTVQDIDPALVEKASVTYMEGYLWDPEQAKDAFRKAIDLAHKAGRQTAFSLSDSFCVQRHKAEFRQLAAQDIDILFANEQELCALYDTHDLADALTAVQTNCAIAAITRGAQGCVVVSAKDRIEIPGIPVKKLVDTTGAGDLFAAGFLHGYSRGESLAACGRLGNLVAAEVITHMGARPDVDLKHYVADHPAGENLSA